MGEIGIPRQEFLNEIKFWEIRSIIRGYNARHHAGWEQARFVAYHVRYCMGAGKDETVPDVLHWHPFMWERPEPIPQEDIDDINEEMNAILKNQKQL